MEALGLFEPREVVRRKGQAEQIFDDLRKPRRNQEIALRRQLAHEQFEYRRAVHPLLEVRLQHRELVQVGKQDGGGHGANIAWRGRVGQHRAF